MSRAFFVTCGNIQHPHISVSQVAVGEEGGGRQEKLLKKYSGHFADENQSIIFQVP